ncbi:hypothetical protein C1H46_034851 [Malus baccata]|uniref:GDSL esterase/lipase n=1 Tax=Malus baccata TaxID=106549 RepID=A0A540KZE1_MALBA|nr:hypothetical protein C1H46_034851 [Malus baccata]
MGQTMQHWHPLCFCQTLPHLLLESKLKSFTTPRINKVFVGSDYSIVVGSDYFDCCCLELIRLPSLDVIGKSLYTLYIGQNYFTSNLGAIGVGGVKQYLPQVVLQIACTIKELYGLGGRAFLVLNLAPIDGLNTKVINGSPVSATACSDPYNYVSWDGVHATEAANKLTSWAILNGSLFLLSAVLGPPPYSLSKSFFFQRFDWIMKALVYLPTKSHSTRT